MESYLLKCGLMVILLAFITVTEADKMVTVGNITTKVLGQSGKITIYSGMNETKGVKITFDFLKEYDTNGETIKGQSQHSFNTFASQTFTFTDPENSTFGEDNVTVTQFSFVAEISVDGQTAKLTSYVYIFTEAGNITVDNETVEVKVGDVKFNAMIEDWPFCGTESVTCQSGQTAVVGQYLDFGIEMKGDGDAAPNMQTGSTYGLGNDTRVIVPKQVIYDGGDPMDMPTGYPKLETQGSKQLFIFRFEKFNTSALYDPIVSIDDESDSGTSGGDTTPAPETTKTLSDSDIKVDVVGKSGKIKIAADENMVTVEFDNLNEMTSAGEAVKTNGHQFNTFANQDFTFSEMVEENYQNIAVKKIEFSAQLTNGASLAVYLYLFKAAGNITNGDEEVMVAKGTVKFTVNVTGWKFCGDTGVTCTQGNTNEVGSYLDFDVVVKGKTDPASVQTGTGKKFSVGSGDVLFLTKYTKDASGTFVAMPDNYPMLSTQGSKKIFTMRFEKFATSVMYDPVVEMSRNTNGSDAIAASIASLLLLTLIHVVRKFTL